MRATTGQILGKAHRLCEALSRTEVPIREFKGMTTKELRPAVEDAVKFYIGETSNLPKITDDLRDSIVLHLPAKLMLIEGEGYAIVKGEFVPMTLFCLCSEFTTGIIHTFFFGLKKGGFFSCGGGVIFYHNGEMSFKSFIADESYSTLQTSEGIEIVLRTLLALSCTNVRSVDNAPPGALNKKRQKQGKLPLFTYKTLHVVAGERGASHDPRGDDAEAKRSPRLHFRRGHVRRIGGGRVTWVQQCMVGNARLGVIEKAYALEAR